MNNGILFFRTFHPTKLNLRIIIQSWTAWFKKTNAVLSIIFLDIFSEMMRQGISTKMYWNILRQSEKWESTSNPFWIVQFHALRLCLSIMKNGQIIDKPWLFHAILVIFTKLSINLQKFRNVSGNYNPNFVKR